MSENEGARAECAECGCTWTLPPGAVPSGSVDCPGCGRAVVLYLAKAYGKPLTAQDQQAHSPDVKPWPLYPMLRAFLAGEGGHARREECACKVCRQRAEVEAVLVELNLLRTQVTRYQTQSDARVRDLEAQAVRAESHAKMAERVAHERQEERDEARRRHATYLESIGPALDSVRLRRPSGEPLRSDREEILSLVQEVQSYRTAREQVTALFRRLRRWLEEA